MLFNYKNKNNINLVVNMAQITHIVFIGLAVLFFIHMFVKINECSTIQIIYLHALVVIIVGIGCMINAEAIVAMLSLNKQPN